MYIDALKDEGVREKALLDIGGGIGTIQLELLSAGLSSATNVEGSTAYIEASMDEAERQSHSDRVNSYHGDFVDLAPNIPSADIVTLDLVICCYHDMKALVGLSSARASKLYGVVYPRDKWGTRIGGAPKELSEFEIRDPDWLVQHLKETLLSIFEPTDELEHCHKAILSSRVRISANHDIFY